MDAKKSHENKDLDLSSTVASEDVTVDEGYASRNGESFIDDSTVFPHSPSLKTANHEQKLSPSIESSEQALVGDENPATSDIKIWDKISRTVESFSQNAITFLSWIEEMEEISRHETFQSPFFDSQTSRKSAVANHLQRIFSDVEKDAFLLSTDLPSEKDTVLAVLKRLKNRCQEFNIRIKNPSLEISSDQSSGFHSTADHLPLKIKDKLTDLSKISDEFSSSSSTADLATSDSESERKSNCEEVSEEDWDIPKFCFLANDGGFSLTRRSLSRRENWRQFIVEYKAIFDWLKKMESVIATTEQSDLPATDQEKIFQGYYHQFMTSKPKRECLNIKSNYIGTMFPEIRNDADKKMGEIDDLWTSLMLRLSYHLFPYIIVKNKSMEANNECLSEKRKDVSDPKDLSEQPNLDSDQEILLNDYSFHQTRDLLTFDDNDDDSGWSLHIQSYNKWLALLEDEAYKKENSLTIGWEPDRLTALLQANENHRKTLEDERKAIDALVFSSPASLSLDSPALTNSHLWSVIMLQQRYTSLVLFTLDMECILERRLEIISKNATGQTLSYPTAEMWTEHGFDMRSSCNDVIQHDEVPSTS